MDVDPRILRIPNRSVSSTSVDLMTRSRFQVLPVTPAADGTTLTSFADPFTNETVEERNARMAFYLVPMPDHWPLLYHEPRFRGIWPYVIKKFIDRFYVGVVCAYSEGFYMVN